MGGDRQEKGERDDVEITIQVPIALEQPLQHFQDRLLEILERGLREIMAEQAGSFQDESAIIELLTSRPTPEQILSVRPSPELQARVSELLARNKAGELSRQEELELYAKASAELDEENYEHPVKPDALVAGQECVVLGVVRVIT